MKCLSKNLSRYSIAVAGFSAALAVVGANAAPVAITNNSFEDPALGDGSFVTSGSGTGTLNGWNFAVADGPSFEDFGIENSGGGAYTGAAGAGTPSGADGTNVAFLNMNAVGLATTTFQNVGALQANTDYTLTVAIGQRLDRVNGSVEIALLNAATGATDVFATGTILNSTTNVSAVAGTFQDFVVTFTTGAVVSDDLYVGARFIDDGTIQGSVDNFRLDASAVPEPASLALLGLGGLAMLGRRHRHG